MSDDLLIKISADAKDVKTAYDNVKAQTEDLEGALSKLATISGVAFAALTAQVGLSVKAFADSENASRQLSNALQNQGIFTTELRDQYKSYVDEVSDSTGVSKDQLTQAQAVAQQFIGQIPITQKLTKAIADLAQGQGVSLTSAAEELGKAIGNGTGQLLRQGLQVSENSTESERYAQVLDFVNSRYANAATALDPVTLATKKFGEAVQESQEELGSRFAPAVAAAIDAVTNFLKPAKDASGIMADLKAGAIVAGFAIAGVGTAVGVVGNAIIFLRAALVALNTQLTLTQALLVGLGIGALSIALTEVVLHFHQVSAAVQALLADWREFGSVAEGVAKILGGFVVLDFETMKEGAQEVSKAWTKTSTDVSSAWTNATTDVKKNAEVQNQTQADLAAKQRARTAEEEAYRKARVAEQSAAVLAQLKGASAAYLAIKKQEVDTLKALETEKDTKIRALLRAQYDKEKEDEKTQQAEDLQIQKDFDKLKESAQAEHGNATVELQTQADRKQLAEIQASTETQETAAKKVYLDDLREQVKAHNTYLEEQRKYGTAYAAINKIMHSAEVEGLKSATSDLVDLTQSKNATLKEIGKVASIAQIVIKTGEAAMNIYAGFSTIPIIGPALGIAGAAAAIAFGAEQVGNVSAAATGALVGGTGYGDSQPYLLEPGEIVAPRQNFNEVIDSVAQARGYSPPGSDQTNQGAGYAEVRLTLADDLMDLIEAQLVKRKFLNISIQGSR